MGPVIVPTLQRRKLRFRKVNTLVRLINGRMDLAPKPIP